MHETGTETPQQLLAREDLAPEQKIEILRQWELDLRERMVAEEENMGATEPGSMTLDEVLIALDALGAAPALHPVPTTHG
ncbi:MAG: hypothetical protein PVJ15_02230 [Gammaproteobacteria bacterium]|jgi:hypothetical protein